MSGPEIKQKIYSNNKQIEELQKDAIGNFVLNNKISELITENKRLQAICNHVFDEKGVCTYCGVEKREN